MPPHDTPGISGQQVMVDFEACKWPNKLVNGSDELAQRFDSLNEPSLSNLDSILEMEEDAVGTRPPLITFSHFLPLQARLWLSASRHASPLNQAATPSTARSCMISVW